MLLATVAERDRDFAQAVTLYEESVALRRDGGGGALYEMLYFLGRAALRLGEVERAAACYRESLSLAREQGDRSFIPFNLIGLAAVARASGRLPPAARLLGAAAGMLTSFRVLLAPPDRRSHDRLVEAVRAAVGEERFAQE